MSEETQDQAPAEGTTETPPEDSLDSLLKEYEAASPEDSSEKTEEPKDNPEVSQLRERLDRLERERIEEESTKAVNEAVSAIKKHGELSISDRVVRGFLEDSARADRRIVQAFQQRHANPSGYDKVLEALADDLKKELSGPDAKLTEQSEAVRNAVKQQSETTEEKPSNRDLSQMSDKEFRNYKASLG